MPSAPKAPTPKAPDIKVGDVVLDRYRVVEQIGSGGHSVVYKGQDERLSRPVCIKIFSGLGGDSGVGRTSYEHFVQEAFALSRLTHPNTLRIYDFGHLGPKEAAGMPLQVCEYMNGGTLSNVLREQGKQSLAETVRVISAMCAALSEAHALGIVHRDIKPQNILFGSVGANRLPKLADFGIAKWSADSEKDKEQRAEDTAIVAGQKLAMYSPSWAAPEQLAGQPVSPATDIYSLACVAIYMLSTKAIFADEDVYAGYKKRRHADELVRETLQPLGIPRQVIDVLSRALAFDPKKRLSKVDELSNELQTAIEPMTEEQPRSPVTPPPKQGPATAPLGTVEPPTVDRLPPPPAVRKTPAKTPVAEGTETAPLGSPPKPPTSTGGALSETHPAQAIATPPGPPAADLTPQAYYAPSGVQAWMQVAPAPQQNAPVRRLALMDVPQPVGGDRRAHFLMVNDTVDIAGLHGTKVRITLMPGPSGNRVVHVKGLTCFVAILGGRPSPAVYVDRSTDVALVTPRAQEIGHLRIANGIPSGAQNMFQVGADAVSVGIEDCVDPILFDFGPGSDCYFVYTRGRTVPKSGRRG
ncbi:MAG TPA: protein kinase [Kofleriaceae bacterium]|nr:protein kinase [Kofleriaceae bacterium]